MHDIEPRLAPSLPPTSLESPSALTLASSLHPHNKAALSDVLVGEARSWDPWAKGEWLDRWMGRA